MKRGDVSRRIEGFFREESERSTRFVLVLADPPWSYANKGNRASPDHNLKAEGKRRRASGYETMTAEEIAALPVRNLVAERAILGLWTTSAMLIGTPGEPSPVSVVLAGWGFVGVIVVPWFKGRWRDPEDDGLGLVHHVGLGNYVRHASEYLVIAQRGKPKIPPKCRQVGVLHPRGRHSAKPETARDFLDRLVPDGPRCELFAREEVRGWATWGYDSPEPSPVLTRVLGPTRR